MKYLVPLFLAFSIQANSQAIHFKSVLVDTHNDAVSACLEKNVSLDQDLTGINHSDLKRFKKGGVDYQLFSIFCDGEKKKSIRLGYEADGYPGCSSFQKPRQNGSC